MKKGHHPPDQDVFKWIRAWKTAFASARTRSGPHMVACTATPISIGLQPSGKSWRHQRPRSPVNRPRKRSDGRLYVRRLPERSRWPANAAHHPASRFMSRKLKVIWLAESGTHRSRPRCPAPLVEPGAVFTHLLALRCRRVALAGRGLVALGRRAPTQLDAVVGVVRHLE